jgi:hypothetical protein
MNELMKRVHEYAKTQGIDNVHIAKHIGVQPASVTYYFDGTNHMNFSKFIRMIHLIYKTDHEDLIMEYCEYCDSFPKKKPQAVREALDWSLGRWNNKLTQYLLDLEKEYSPKTHEIYNLLFLSSRKKITPKEFFKKVHYLPYNLKGVKKQDLPIVQVLIDLCNMYYHHYRKDYEAIYDLAQFTFEKIENISSEFLRYSYTLCVKEMLTLYYLRYNKIDRCCEAADELMKDDVKNLYPLTYLYGLHLLSEIYTFTNYETSLYYIDKAIYEMEKMNFNHYARKYEGFKAHRDFIKIINKDYDGLSLNDDDQRLHYLAMLGDERSREEANKILQNILNNGNGLDEFQTCYQAILNRDLQLMIRAEEMFMVSNDFYYVKLARKYIKEWGGIKESKCVV